VQWPGKFFPKIKVFPNCIQMIRASKIQKGNLQGFKIFQTLPGSRQIQKEQLSFGWDFKFPAEFELKIQEVIHI
jgi:hypothetical protein